MRCALVIPTRNAGAHLDRLLPALAAQRRQPDSILVVDSRSSDDTVERFRAFGARVAVIEPASFNHGGTRRWASQQVEADALIYLTQDAIPASPDSFANLLDELYAEADIGVAYGRQLPHPGAGLLGAQARRFNYPPESRSKRLAACNTPARIPAPDSDTVDSGKRALEELARLPPAMERVRVGDTLRIVRDAGEMPTLSAFNVATIYELTLYTVLNDGSIYYPFIGRIQAAHRTPQEIANELTTKLAPIYREPRVTVNINQAPGNTVFVGGAVRNPSAVPIPAANNMEQAILGAGGILPVGDARRVALMREDSEGRYHAYFLDFSQLMKIGPEGRKPLAMQRGDIVFVPKSMVGDRIEGVDVYLNQLLPFAKSIGVGVSYTVNNDR